MSRLGNKQSRTRDGNWIGNEHEWQKCEAPLSDTESCTRLPPGPQLLEAAVHHGRMGLFGEQGGEERLR